jgi:synaptobrevin family protein YKT6
MVTDREYPALVAHQVLSKIVDEFLNKNPVANWINSDAKVPFPELKEYLVKYQNPEEADSIMKIQKELDETKIVLHKTIQSVLERGESMNKLAENSERLSFSTKAFAKQAQKENSCWYVKLFVLLGQNFTNPCVVSLCKGSTYMELWSPVVDGLDNENVDMTSTQGE